MTEIKFYKTHIFLEVVVDTQFGPQSAIGLIKHRLDIPAISKAEIVKAYSDYLPQSVLDANHVVLTSIPITIK